MEGICEKDGHRIKERKKTKEGLKKDPFLSLNFQSIECYNPSSTLQFPKQIYVCLSFASPNPLKGKTGLLLYPLYRRKQ